MARFVDVVPPPPVEADTVEEQRAYYRDVERERDRMISERPSPDEY